MKTGRSEGGRLRRSGGDRLLTLLVVVGAFLGTAGKPRSKKSAVAWPQTS